MVDGIGLRERKKAQTREHLKNVALGLFLERGFDGVTVSEIAAAADVSKMTVLNYFATKEDIVASPMEEHVDELARIVRSRAPGESAVAALRRQFHQALAERDPATGLNDHPKVRALRRLMSSTPGLLLRILGFASRSADALTEAFAEETGAGPGDLTPRIAAAQIVAARLALVTENDRRIAAGESADAVYPDAVAAADRAFDLLEYGLAGYPVPGAPPASRTAGPPPR
jgi:AcrR family transcriptional regulator